MTVVYWLLVERLENWEIDQQEGFRRFGLPERKKKLASEIKSGDFLIFYVSSGISKFSDIRQATADGTAKLGNSGNYDTGFQLSVSTRPHLILPKEKWVPLHGLIDKLSITAGKGDWRQVMRNSLRRLGDDDAAIIVNAIEEAKP